MSENPTSPQQGVPPQPQPGVPQQPPQGAPQAPQGGYPQAGFPPQGYPQQPGFPPQGYPQQGGYPPQGYPQQGAYPPQGYPQQGANPGYARPAYGPQAGFAPGGGQPPAPRASSNKILLIVIGAVVLLVIAGAALLMLSNRQAPVDPVKPGPVPTVPTATASATTAPQPTESATATAGPTEEPTENPAPEPTQPSGGVIDLGNGVMFLPADGWEIQEQAPNAVSVSDGKAVFVTRVVQQKKNTNPGQLCDAFNRQALEGSAGAKFGEVKDLDIKLKNLGVSQCAAAYIATSSGKSIQMLVLTFSAVRTTDGVATLSTVLFTKDTPDTSFTDADKMLGVVLASQSAG